MEGPYNNRDSFETWEIYRSLTSLKKTATGPDKIPAWFLKLTAEFISPPVKDMLNQSIYRGTVPNQWKMAIITPIPKTAKAVEAAEFRPISVTSVLSRMSERMIAKKFIINSIVCSEKFKDQYAFRPSSSTTAAIIATVKEIVTILEHAKYARLIQLDFSKAFDTVRHKTLFEKLSNLNISIEIYNWLHSFFYQHRQCTKFKGQLSSLTSVNSGVIQGSALGPIMFTVLVSDLHPKCLDNKMVKYADDTNVIIHQKNIQRSSEELENIKAWSVTNNLTLNNNKSKEIIFKRPKAKEPDEMPDIKRVNYINILGVSVNNMLQVTQHVDNIIKKCNSNIYAIKILKNKGLSTDNIKNIYNALVIGRLMYAIPAWWGMTTKKDQNRISRYIKKSIRYGYCQTDADITKMVKKADQRLLQKIERDGEVHPLRQFLTIRDDAGRVLRQRNHSFDVPLINSANKKDFLTRSLHDL